MRVERSTHKHDMSNPVASSFPNSTTALHNPQTQQGLQHPRPKTQDPKMRPPLVLVAATAVMAVVGTATAFVVRPPAPATTSSRAAATAGVRVRMMDATGASTSGSSSRRSLLEDAGKMGLLTLGLVGGVR